MRRLASALILLSALAAGSHALTQTDADEPAESDLVERTEAQLAQVDITISGPPEVVNNLTVDDFKLKVNLKKVHSFQLDRLCNLPTDEIAEAPAPLIRSPVSYLFYFDQSHLTLQGRARGIDVVLELIPELIRDGSRGMLVSNASRFKVIETWTTDPERLKLAVKRLEQDRSQWQFFAEEEATRVDEVVDTMNWEAQDNLARSIDLARFYQREEVWRTDKSLRRLRMSLATLAEFTPPKAVVYLADTMRDNPGEHYLSFFGVNTEAAWVLGADHLLAKHPFDRVVNEAVSQSIRFYPVLAEGLVNPQDFVVASGRSVALTGTINNSSRVRLRDAQRTLANLATETGGQHFIHGDRPSRIAERILRDFDCVYLLSFDPTGFKRDAPLRIVLKTTRDDIEIHSRGRVMFQSESRRQTSRLLSAFLDESANEGLSGLQASLVPSGFDDGAYSALLQISLPGTMLPQSSWDLGASMVSKQKVREEISGRVEVRQLGVPVVLEGEVRLKPGEHEIVSVARESSSDFLLSDRKTVDWPDPNGHPATCGPFVVVQPSSGAFLRDGVPRLAGSLVRGKDEPLDPALPTALMGLVCRGRRQRGPFEVRRSLDGLSRVDFPPLEFELKEDRCAQIRDLIPAYALGPGTYHYEVRVSQGDALLDEIEREFVVGER